MASYQFHKTQSPNESKNFINAKYLGHDIISPRYTVHYQITIFDDYNCIYFRGTAVIPILVINHVIDHVDLLVTLIFLFLFYITFIFYIFFSSNICARFPRSINHTRVFRRVVGVSMVTDRWPRNVTLRISQ